jgi:hypothetical protein
LREHVVRVARGSKRLTCAKVVMREWILFAYFYIVVASAFQLMTSIDSLCIMQNDPMDIKEEMPKLASIYQGNFLNIMTCTEDGSNVENIYWS